METKFTLSRPVAALLAVISLVLLSPKWMFAPAAWVAPFFLMYAIRGLKAWKAYILVALLGWISLSISYYKVMPFPGIVLYVMTLIISLQAAIPFWLNHLLYPKFNGWVKTLIFPCLFTAYEFLSAYGGGGTWGSLAYTQFSNSPLIQIVSLTGIWGVTFLICWCSSIIYFVVEHKFIWHNIRRKVIAFVLVFAGLTFYGFIRLSTISKEEKTVRVAAITDSNLPLLQAMYDDAFHKNFPIDENELSQTSPELAELNKGFAAFIENPDSLKFPTTLRVEAEHEDFLFDQSEKAVHAKAKIIAWSEALVLIPTTQEHRLLDRAAEFTRNHKVYLLITLGAFHPGKFEMGKKFIENKAILFGPDGNILNRFFKNRPVPMIEPSIAGDGKVPVIQTLQGNIAISICYDADFPQLMRQAGKGGAGLLLLPSGDWKEVSPYHAQMAAVRAIENGMSLVRPVSNAVTVLANANGKILASGNYYNVDQRVVIADISADHHKTLYNRWGDWFIVVCVVITSIAVFSVIQKKYFLAKTASV